MCYIAIPGQTGCVAQRDVKLVRRRVMQKESVSISVVAKMLGQIAGVVLPRGEPRFSGGTLVKTTTPLWDRGRSDESLRAGNAKQHSRVRPKRVTIRGSF